LIWNTADQGRSYQLSSLSDDELKLGKDKQMELIDCLSGEDDELADYIISNDSLENIEPDLLQKALRKATVNQKIVPVLLGSAYKNAGIQPLIDSVIHYLPAPNERNNVYDNFGWVQSCELILSFINSFSFWFRDDFVGKIFKVTHDKQRGALSLVRIFRGSLKKGARITTANGTSENVQRLYEPLADEYREIAECGAGNIVVCSGLKVM
jgi:elongation factor G